MRRVAPLLLAAAAACSPAVSDSGGGESGSDSSSTGTTAPVTDATSGTVDTSAGATSSTVSSSTSTTVTTFPPTTASTSGDESSDTSAVTTFETTESSTSSGDCVDDGIYRAVSIIGALDRVRIFRRDDAGSCIWLTLASPVEGSMYDVVSTPSWGLEQVSRNTDPASCDDDDPGAIESIPVPDAYGTIDITPGPTGFPCTIDIQVELQLLENPDPPVVVDLCPQLTDLDGCAP